MEQPIGHVVFFWLLFTACLTIFIIQTSGFIRKYLDRETSISLKTVRTSTTEFPSVTICPDYDVAYKEEVLEKFKVSKHDIRSLQIPSYKQNLTSLQFFDLVTHDLTDILASLTIKTLNKYPDTNYTKLTLVNPLESFDPGNSYTEQKVKYKVSEWWTYFYAPFGRCFYYSIPYNYKKLGVVDLAFLMKMNSIVYIHHPKQFFAPDTDTKVTISLGTNVFLVVTHDVMQTLPRTIYHENGDSHISCLDESGEDYDTCIRHAYDIELMEKFNCTSPFLNLNNENMCEIGNFSHLEKANFYEIHKETMNVAHASYCRLPCTTMGIKFGLPITSSTDISPDKAYLKLYFKSQINERKSNYSYSLSLLVADIGGYLGLLLGFSVLDLTNLLNNRPVMIQCLLEIMQKMVQCFKSKCFKSK